MLDTVPIPDPRPFASFVRIASNQTLLDSHAQRVNPIFCRFLVIYRFYCFEVPSILITLQNHPRVFSRGIEWVSCKPKVNMGWSTIE